MGPLFPGLLALFAVSAAPPATGPARFDIASDKLLVLLAQDELPEALGMPRDRREGLKEWAKKHYDSGLTTAQIVADVAEKFQLPPEKVKRLEEIRHQLLGGHALLLDPKLAEALGLTERQREELNKAREKNNSKLRALKNEIDALRFKSIPDREQYKDPVRHETSEKLLEVLTDEQREELRRKQGAPFGPLKPLKPSRSSDQE